MTALPQPPYRGGDAPLLPFRKAPQTPAPEGGAHRIPDPVRTPGPADAPFDPALLDAFAAMARPAEAQTLRLPAVPPADLERVRSTLSVRRFFDEWMRPYRRRQVELGQIAQGTLDKDMQAVNRLALYEARNPPPSLPPGYEWTGLPLRFLTTAYLEKFFRCLAAGGLKKKSVASTWNHLRGVLRFAAAVGALDAAPERPEGIEDNLKALRRKGEAAVDEDDELFAEIYTTDELGRIFDALDGEPAIQAALVLGANTGPRPVDLFTLRWQLNVRHDVDAPEVTYVARKTGKRHWMPLSDVTAAHLRRMLRREGKLFAKSGGFLFDALTSVKPGCKDPERSRPARRRTAKFKAALEAAGVDVHAKPWQVLRATCNSRLNNHVPGARYGAFLLHGPDHDVNSRHYQNSEAPIREAVRSLPQPPEFLRVL